MMHDCDVTREGFPDLLFGEAEGGARSALLEEVARCEACAREYRMMAETLQVFDQASRAGAPAESFWPGYGERLRMRIEQEIRPNFWGRATGFGGEYRLTFVEDEGLLRRLARELKAVARDAELSWPEFKSDPLGFAARSFTAYGRAVTRFFSQRDVALATVTAFFAVSILVTSVFALEHFRAKQLASANPYENLELLGYADESEIPKEQPTPKEGAAGTNEGHGGGSKQKYEAAHGGGGGGRREESPASRGKLPTPQLDQDPINPASPKPPVPNAHLPVPSVMRVDPALIKPDPSNVPYGLPDSNATAPSSGGGRGGGMGEGSGGGMGVGDGTGLGPGRGYNMGGGDPVEGGGGPGGGGGGRVDYARPFKTSEVTVRAVITSKPEPGFTEEARRDNVTGIVRLRAILSASGEVTGVSVVKGLPGGLTERAISAAKQIRFRPAQKDGRTVSQYVTLEYNFNIY
jgi:TonB family protein